jgi:hypothetical protein
MLASATEVPLMFATAGRARRCRLFEVLVARIIEIAKKSVKLALLMLG